MPSVPNAHSKFRSFSLPTKILPSFRHPAFSYLSSGQDREGILAIGVKQIDREILATIHDLLLRICPDLDPTQGWQVARVTKALYKGMSYLIQQEPEIEKTRGDVNVMIIDMKQMMVAYLEQQLGRISIDRSS
jgi:hypothetical protein